MGRRKKILFLKHSKFRVAAIYFLMFSLFLFTYAFSNVKGIEVSYFLRDPITTMKVPFYIGFLSNVGMFLWAFTVGICFFTCHVMEKSKETEGAKFIFYSGILSFVLLIDDFFLLHEIIMPAYFKISEKLLFLIYAVYLFFIVVKFNKFIMETEYIYLILALFLFFDSLIVDFFREILKLGMKIDSLGMMVEDGSKIFGALTWFIFYAKTCKKLIVSKKDFLNYEKI